MLTHKKQYIMPLVQPTCFVNSYDRVFFLRKMTNNNFDKQYIWQSGMLELSLFDCLSMS